MEIEQDLWQERLDVLARDAGVVGAVLGILRVRDDAPDELVRVATGVLNANTGRTTTVDSLFQIGSITKPITATGIMQLVDEGRIGLDQPVKDILPGFRLVSDELTQGVTVRHLLNHTSGINGDIFTDTGRGDDTLARYVESLATVAQMHPLGEIWSYCNTGYSVLGRIIEVVTGQVWDAAVRTRLFDPLGLTHTVTLPEDALLFDTAVGHLRGLPDPEVTGSWMLPRSSGPAGVITTSVADLLTFARLHMRDGVTRDGRRVVSETGCRAMRDFSVETPATSLFGETWGLGFERMDWGGAFLYGHDGNTLGQSAYLRILPEAGLAVALLTNDDSPGRLYRALFAEVFTGLAGVTMPGTLQLPADPPALDIAPWVGTYERGDTRLEVSAGPEGPLLRVTQIGELAELEHQPEQTYPMTPVREGLYGIYMDRRGCNVPVWLGKTSDGARYVHFSSRLTRQVA